VSQRTHTSTADQAGNPLSGGRHARAASTGASGPIRKELGRPLIARLEELCDGPGTVGLLDVALDLAVIGATITVGVLTFAYVLPPAVCVLYLGIRQRHLSNLGHECVHGKITRSGAANTWVGRLITGLLGESFLPYRLSHQVHHGLLGSPQDPMFQSYLARGATTASRDKRAFVSRVIVGNALWLLPVTAVRTMLTRAEGESWTAVLSRAALWAGLLTAATATGTLGYLLVFWVAPLVFIRPVITWITDLGNHAGVIESGDPVTQTRGWTSHALTRHVLGGHLDDMYHPIHHWCPRIPWRKLPHAEAILRQDYPRWSDVPWCSGFFFRRRSTPQIPCVIDDIVTRLQHRQAS
jgi:fatty acid desaturase